MRSKIAIDNSSKTLKINDFSDRKCNALFTILKMRWAWRGNPLVYNYVEDDSSKKWDGSLVASLEINVRH